MSELQDLSAAMIEHLPEVMRWGGALAKRLRTFQIQLGGKSTGNANTDALTLADISVQELLISALKDRDPLFKTCRLEAEEENVETELFSQTSAYTIAIDPIDGTRQYSERTGDGYGIIILLRSQDDVHCSLVFLPERGPAGRWIVVRDHSIFCGDDQPDLPAHQVVMQLPEVDPNTRPDSNEIYLIGFQDQDLHKAELLQTIGLAGSLTEQLPGNVYELFAQGKLAGSLIHSPNIYDFPVSLQLARILGGDGIFVQTKKPINFESLWYDERAGMLRLPGIVACSHDPLILERLANLAQDWNPERYPK